MSKTTEIIDLYKSGKSTYYISRIYDTHSACIRKLLLLNNIPMRTVSEANKLRFANHTIMSNETEEIMNGWMLGDGHIHFTGAQAYFCLTTKHKEYADYAKNILENDGICCRINKVNNNRFIAFKLFTRSTAQLAKFHRMWYGNGKKIIPHMFKLTTPAIKTWIMDDGTLDKSKGHLRICTCSFSIKDCEILAKQLNGIMKEENGCWVIEKEKYPRIYIPRIYANKLFNIIGKCDVSCFEYKWGKNQV